MKNLPVKAGAERTRGGDPWVALVSLSPSRMENRFFERLDRDIVQVREYSNTQKIK